jgi:hypothetical protein
LLNNARCRYLPEDIAEIAKSASVMFTLKSEQSIHSKITAVLGQSNSVFSVVINDRKRLVKHAPLIFDELNVDMLFEKGKHYDIQINISLSTTSQPYSIFFQSSSTSLEILDQYCFACKRQSSFPPIQVQVHDPPATYLSSFNCNVQFNSKYSYFEGSTL